MSDQIKTNETQVVTQAISRLLDEGSAGVLVTLIGLPEKKPAELRIGSRLLATESGARVGSLGAAELDGEVSRHAHQFLSLREDARLLKAEEFAPGLSEFHGVQLLFEHIEAEPRLVIAGAGHVGASLARLASLVGYRVTLIDDRAEFLSRDLFATPSEQGIELVVAEDWSLGMREAIATRRGVSVAIVSRGHNQEENRLRAPLSSNP